MLPEEMEFPAKLFDTRYYVRMGKDELPELIRVEPLLTSNNDIVPGTVIFAVDNGEPMYINRDAAEALVADCTPIRVMTQGKHKTASGEWRLN